mmetsp:Transcript_24251/g.31581  ORF Transcript_24251/g.31581 Transcript_24251/m.31581 type:complete len:121 (-) Transcript_24251:391-753(-)
MYLLKFVEIPLQPLDHLKTESKIKIPLRFLPPIMATQHAIFLYRRMFAPGVATPVCVCNKNIIFMMKIITHCVLSSEYFDQLRMIRHYCVDPSQVLKYSSMLSDFVVAGGRGERDTNNVT